jgi:hypothetical protein
MKSHFQEENELGKSFNDFRHYLKSCIAMQDEKEFKALRKRVLLVVYAFCQIDITFLNVLWPMLQTFLIIN